MFGGWHEERDPSGATNPAYLNDTYELILGMPAVAPIPLSFSAPAQASWTCSCCPPSPTPPFFFPTAQSLSLGVSDTAGHQPGGV